MLLYSDPAAPDCRTYVVPPCERDCAISGTAVEAVATFHMRLRDKIDFTVDFTQWLARNGGAQLSAASFAVASGSPKTPTFSSAFTPSGKCAVVVQAQNGDAVGDAYWLDLTVTVAATTGDLVLPTRTLVRRVNIVLTNG